MFYDSDTNTVCIADALRRYPDVAKSIVGALGEYGINHKIIKGTKNIWVRDYMPLQVDDRYVKFIYKGYGASYDKYPQLYAPDSCFGFLSNVVLSDIVLDGGNCQRYGNKAIITDIIFKQNPNIDRDKLMEKLSSLLRSDIIIIPREPGDNTIGHSDGILKFINEDTVLVHDYSVMGESYGYNDYHGELLKALDKATLNHVMFPYAYNRQPRLTEKQFRLKYPDADLFDPAMGYYVNFLLAGKSILVPTFGFPEDDKALDILEDCFPDCDVAGIDCSDLAMEGGCLSCISMNYKM
jgi:agmatine/peptidylarginine deiminase